MPVWGSSEDSEYDKFMHKLYEFDYGFINTVQCM